jgi:hypothetical protein
MPVTCTEEEEWHSCVGFMPQHPYSPILYPLVTRSLLSLPWLSRAISFLKNYLPDFDGAVFLMEIDLALISVIFYKQGGI